MDEDPNGRGEGGGVVGEMSVAKRSSMAGLVGRMGVPLPAGRGIRGGMDRNGEGIELGKGKGRLELGGTWTLGGERTL